ncbi:hypothetical protein SUGI_0692720 [Cryptomeria japonica]|nr:hypothetical protein SUGI_0692720 [Cryptomeria japonica]
MMAHITRGGEEQTRSWERIIIAPDGTQLCFVGKPTENTAVQTDYEKFCCEVYLLPGHVLIMKLAFCFGPGVQLKEEFVGVVLEGFVRIVNAENCAYLQANAEANNGRAMVLVDKQGNSTHLHLYYYIQGFTAQDIIGGSNNDYAESDEQGEQISHDAVQISHGDQNLINTEDSENEMEPHFYSNVTVQDLYSNANLGVAECIAYGLFVLNTAGFLLLADYFGINVYSLDETPEISDEEAAEILGSPSERINCDVEDLCVICFDSLENSCEDLKQLPCKHVYHYKCILRSTKFNNSCPLCREKFNYREGHSC